MRSRLFEPALLRTAADEPVVLARAHEHARHRGLRPLPAARVARELDRWLAEPASRRVLLDLYAACAPGAVAAGVVRASDVPRGMRAWLRAALERGELVALAPADELARRYDPLPLARRAEAADPLPADDTWVEFLFEYPDGRPVSDVGYVLTEPGGRTQEGTLPADGAVARSRCAPGIYTIALKTVDRVSWEHARVRCDEPARVLAHTTGYADGAEATVRVFREHREGDHEAVATLAARVERGALEATFRYDPGASGEPAGAEGVRRFVAEVALDGGRVWAKTILPLEPQLPTFVAARWSAPQVASGAVVRVRVEALGFADDTAVALELWRRLASGEERRVGALPDAPLVAGRAVSVLHYRDDAGSGVEIDAPGEYLVRVRVAGDARYAGVTGPLWCRHAEPGAALPRAPGG